jgi:hypothetical protein
MDWQNQHSINSYTTKTNLHVQHNSHQNHNDIHHRDWKNLPKVHLETQKTINSQGNTHQKEQCWRYHNTRLQTILQSLSKKNSMVLAQKQTWRPVEQNRRTIYISTQLHPPNFWQRSKTYNKDSLFNKCFWENWLSACRKLKLEPCLSPCININSMWIKVLIIRPKTLTLVQEIHWKQ